MVDLAALFGTRYPLIQAPMAGVQGSALAIAVGQVGALGSLPAAMLSPDALRAELSRLREAGVPYNVNFFAHTPPAPDADAEARWRAALAPYFAEQGGMVRSYVVDNEILTRLQDRLPFMPSAIGHREILPPHGSGPFATFGAHGTDAVMRSFDQRFPDGPRPQHAPDEGVWYLDPETGRFSLAPPEGG